MVLLTGLRYYGDLVFGSQNPGDKVTTDTDILSYIKKDGRGFPQAPLSITLTEFHFLLLYEDRLQVCSWWKQRMILMILPGYLQVEWQGCVWAWIQSKDNEASRSCSRSYQGHYLDLWRTGTFCIIHLPCGASLILFKVVYELSVHNEERDVWTIYLEKEQFETSLQYCKEPYPHHSFLWFYFFDFLY